VGEFGRAVERAPAGWWWGVNRRLVAAVVALLVVGPALAPVGAGAAAPVDPRFETFVPQPTLTPGQPNEVAVQVVNDASDAGDVARTAGSVEVTLTADGTPLSVRSGTTALGAMPDGRPVTTTHVVTVPYDVEAGSYDLTMTVEYTIGGDRKRTTKTVEVRVPERPVFEVTDVSHDVDVGDSGTVELTVENVGSEAASASTVTLQSTSGQVALGGGGAASRFAGTLDPDESVTLSFDASVAPGAARQPYALRATVEYTGEDGTPGRSRAISLGVTPGPEQEFAVENVSSTLQVGEEGELAGTLRNEGDDPVRDVVVLLESGSPGVSPLEFEVPVGTVPGGGTADFSFAIDVSGETEPGPERFSMVVEYRTRGDDRRKKDPVDARATVAPARDSFAVSGAAATVSAGGSTTLKLEVTNRREEPVEDVTAKLFADDPVSVSDDEAYAASLDPGESTVLSFAIDTAGSAQPKDYPVEVDFQYRTADGDTRLSDTFTVAVTVEESGGGGLPLGLVAGGVVVAALVAGAVVFATRRG
jgi:hypothetical protein